MLQNQGGVANTCGIMSGHSGICGFVFWFFCNAFSLLLPDFPFFCYLSLPSFSLSLPTFSSFLVLISFSIFTFLTPSKSFAHRPHVWYLLFLPSTRYLLVSYFFVSSHKNTWIQWSWWQLVCSLYKNYSRWTPRGKENSKVEIQPRLIDRQCRSASKPVVHLQLLISYTFDMGLMKVILGYLIISINTGFCLYECRKSAEKKSYHSSALHASPRSDR